MRKTNPEIAALRHSLEVAERRRDREAERLAATKREVREIRSRLREVGVSVRRRTNLDPHQQAGGRNIASMLTVFARHRTLTQSDASRLSGVGNGTTTWAIKALLKDGAIVSTGRRIGRSEEFRYVPKTRRETTLRPGQ